MRNNQTTEWTLDCASYSDHAWLMLSLPAKTWKSPHVSINEGRSALALSFHTFNLKTIHYLTVKMFNCETQKCLNVPTNISSIFHFNNEWQRPWLCAVYCVSSTIHLRLNEEWFSDAKRKGDQWSKHWTKKIEAQILFGRRRYLGGTATFQLAEIFWQAKIFWWAEIFWSGEILSISQLSVLALKNVEVDKGTKWCFGLAKR